MHTWTVEEARSYLPRLRQILPELRSAVPERAEAVLAELEARGVILRQLPNGLVDFPSVGADGEIRMLCWQVDEPELAYWHRPEDGFAGRRRLEDEDR